MLLLLLLLLHIHLPAPTMHTRNEERAADDEVEKRAEEMKEDLLATSFSAFCLMSMLLQFLCWGIMRNDYDLPTTSYLLRVPTI